MKHYAPNRMLAPKEGSSQNMKVRMLVGWLFWA